METQETRPHVQPVSCSRSRPRRPCISAIFADPNTGERAEPNLAAAAQMIELIAMLQERTKGNLHEPEEQLVDDLLYELRMRFVQAQQGEKRIIDALDRLQITFLGTGTSHGVPMIGCDCATCRSTDPRDRRLRPSLLVEAADGTSAAGRCRARPARAGADARHHARGRASSSRTATPITSWAWTTSGDSTRCRSGRCRATPTS